MAEKADEASLLLGHAPAVIAIVGGLAVLLSVVRQIGFFLVFEPDLLSLMSIQNIVENSILNLPSAIGSIFVGAFVRTLRPPGGGGAPPRGVLGFFIGMMFRPMRGWDLWFTVALALLFVLFDPRWALPLQFVAIFVWGSILGWLQTQAHLSEKPFIYEITAAAYFVVVWLLIGIGDAQSISREPDFIIRQDGKETPIRLARMSSDFLIGMTSEGKVVALPRDGVTIERIKLHEPKATIDLEPVGTFIKNMLAAPASVPTSVPVPGETKP